MTNRIIEVLEEKGRFYFVEEKDEVINKMVKEWERSVNGLLEEELNVGKFETTKWFMQEIYDFEVSNQEEIKEEKEPIKETAMVGIQVRLVNVETGRYITGSGLDINKKEGEGLLKNLDMSFDQSTVSFATTGKPNDTFMGMSLNSGGHITHGLKISMSGKWFNAISYDVDKKSELIDYDNVEKLALEHKPKLIIAGGSAYSRVIDFKRFRHILWLIWLISQV